MKVSYIDHMGSDLSVVNAARVSFGKESDWDYKCVCDRGPCAPDCPYGEKQLSKGDKGLIQFLARGCASKDWESLLRDAACRGELWVSTDEVPSTGRIRYEEVLNHIRRMPDHWTPFGHTAITLHIKAPIFVARQLGKHQVGMVWNEVSRRYVTDEPEFYDPDEWRKAADSVKQGSSDETVSKIKGSIISHPFNHQTEKSHLVKVGRTKPGYYSIQKDYNIYLKVVKNIYEHLLQGGVCPEQARMVLPQSMYTEWYWTGNLYSFANVFKQRTDSHAQKEVQDVAHQIGEIISPLYPESWKALTQ